MRILAHDPETGSSGRQPSRSLHHRFAAASVALTLAFMMPVAAHAAPRGHAGPPSGVLRATLGNGLRVVIVRNTLAPVVTTMVNYLVGSDETPPGFPGTAHAQEHMMFRGSPGLSADQLSEISASIGGAFNADTRNTVTQYFFSAPAEDLGLALHIEAIRMRAVDDNDSLWNKERGAIEQEVAQDNSNPFYKFDERMLAALYKGTPLAHSGLGTRPSFDKTTGKMLRSFYNEWYGPNNAVLVIVGDVNPDSALGVVKRLFGDIPRKRLPARPTVALRPVTPDTMTIPSDFPFGLAAIAFRMPGTNSPDYAAAQVLSDVVSSQRGTLYALVPSGKALFAQLALNTMPESSVGLALVGYPKGADAHALVQQVRQILKADIANGFPQDLVEAAKRRELAQAELQKNSVSGLAFAWSEAVAVEGRKSPDDDIHAIEAVTPDAVARVARKYLLFNHAITAILPPEPSGKPTSQSSFGGRESFASKNVKPVALPTWASTALAHLTVPASTVRPTVDTLPNGITLIVQPESVSNTVSVYGHIRNEPDLETPKGQDGVAGVLDRLFEFGTTTRNRLQFQAALDSIAANESAGTSFSLSVLAGHFDRGVELLADNELHPALPASAFQTMQHQQAAYVAGEIQSPGYLAGRAQDKALFPAGDPSLRETTPATVSGLTLQQVKDYYTHVFRPDLTTIVVIGNVTPARARAVIAKYFGAWTVSGPKPNTELPAVPPNTPSVATVPDKSRVQDEVTLAETLGITRFSPEYYALQLGNEVLGGGFYASKLGQDLRESTGLVYYVGSSLDAGKTRSTYEVDYACDPDNVSKARALVVKDLEAMQTAPVDSARLERAKAILLRQIPLGESSVGSIARGWIGREDLGLPLDEPTIAARKYLALTGADVQAAFHKVLRPADLVQVVQGPTPQ
ncbi:MAG TPA: pitrilysin family protein [Gemmatimonadales bacterium]|nr:pitrilysin family protein [Gemmatimonadales bacterium]